MLLDKIQSTKVNRLQSHLFSVLLNQSGNPRKHKIHKPFTPSQLLLAQPEEMLILTLRLPDNQNVFIALSDLVVLCFTVN